MNIVKEDISEKDEEINILKWISGSYLEVAWKVEPGNQKFFNIILFSNDWLNGFEGRQCSWDFFSFENKRKQCIFTGNLHTETVACLKGTQ